MAQHCSSVFSMKLQLIEVFLSLATIKGVFGNCYTSIFSFGDSLTDTGNIYFTDPTHHCLFPPYGESYFTHPTGRCCDGRLVLDFTGEQMSLRGIDNVSTNDSLSVQLDWFKKILPSLCNTSSVLNSTQ
ncbi:gdsl esterase/lipase [Quercus suber]|uniref:Gdsl esterase/lipase n=1 Tax=Quercus suber TaxID=58331 RepID=A0AAW0J2Q8_QUESU